MNTFVEIPTYGTSIAPEHRVIENTMGDGYTQRVPDGIHATRLRFDVLFLNVTKAKALRIVTFLRAQGAATPFLWTPPAPYATEIQVVAKFPFQHDILASDKESIRVVFEQDFNPTA